MHTPSADRLTQTECKYQRSKIKIEESPLCGDYFLTQISGGYNMPKRDDIDKVMILGSGPIIIGQACEFDYSGTQACKALRQLGYEIVLVNSNHGSA